ncbi:hypothetical protein DFJ73DRAFT_843930 [Zopfochytrium polystomum]|nr:hypothetical protein DFJ73DRAFT_843930 [Zopfochytrium polystomum]
MCVCVSHAAGERPLHFNSAYLLPFFFFIFYSFSFLKYTKFAELIILSLSLTPAHFLFSSFLSTFTEQKVQQQQLACN